MEKKRSHLTYKRFSRLLGYLTIPLLLLLLLMPGCAAGQGGWSPFVQTNGVYSPGPAAQLLPSVGGAVGGPAGELVGAGVLAVLNAISLWQTQRVRRRLNEHIAGKDGS